MCTFCCGLFIFHFLWELEGSKYRHWIVRLEVTVTFLLKVWEISLLVLYAMIKKSPECLENHRHRSLWAILPHTDALGSSGRRRTVLFTLQSRPLDFGTFTSPLPKLLCNCRRTLLNGGVNGTCSDSLSSLHVGKFPYCFHCSFPFQSWYMPCFCSSPIVLVS